MVSDTFCCVLRDLACAAVGVPFAYVAFACACPLRSQLDENAALEKQRAAFKERCDELARANMNMVNARVFVSSMPGKTAALVVEAISNRN